MRTNLTALIVLMAVGSLVMGVTRPAFAELGDISVGGVWSFRLTRGIAGMSLTDRVADVERRITNVLSNPRYRERGVTLTVRPVGPSAAIMVEDAVILTVTPEDAADTGVKVTTLELARQWARRLVGGINKAFPATFAAF
ncbi:MAG: hypothetical protein ACT4PY_03215 [Armatimonadota bacterium]